MSTLDCCISNALLYKQLNPPKYRTHIFSRNSYMSERLSKVVLIVYDVHGKWRLFDKLVYNNENTVIIYKYSYISNEQMESNRRKNMKRQRLRLNNRKKYVEDNK
jgi:hypothetical protein